MAQTLNRAYKTPAAATDESIYTCPASTKSVFSNINICNKGSATTISVFIKYGGTDTIYLYKDVAISANNTFNRVSGDVLIAADEVWVQSTSGDVDFAISMTENT